jgi:hypothetical protein
MRAEKRIGNAIGERCLLATHSSKTGVADAAASAALPEDTPVPLCHFVKGLLAPVGINLTHTTHNTTGVKTGCHTAVVVLDSC